VSTLHIATHSAIATRQLHITLDRLSIVGQYKIHCFE